MHPVIRLERIELHEFKNIVHGTIEWSNYRNKLFYTNHSDIIGIYGQNGSGKTAVIEAVQLLKLIMCGKPLPKDANHYINRIANESILKFTFYIEVRKDMDQPLERYLIFYECILGHRDVLDRGDFSAVLTEERLSYIKIGQRAKTDIINYQYEESDTIFLPKVRCQEVAKKNSKNYISLEVARQLAKKEIKSFVWCKEVLEAFKENTENDDFTLILSILPVYAKMNLFVVADRSVNPDYIRFLPISFRLEMNHCVSSGEVPISLVGDSLINQSDFELVRCVILQMNLVVQKILPEIYIELIELGKELDKNGQEIRRVELVSVRQGVKIPMKYESAGIKKILTILSALVSVYNDPSICLVVDELDAGIFEYLLGELLAIMEKGGKGQLIFTSHNLRALEKLHKDSIVVSTANPSNRFIRIPHEKANKNYRNTYLRGIDLGGLDEPIYQETNSYEIAYAFMKAGEIFETE